MQTAASAVNAPRQIEDDACAAANLDDVGTLQVAFLEGHASLAQTIRCRWKVKCDLGWLRHAETRGRRGQRFLQIDPYGHVVALRRGNDCLDRVGDSGLRRHRPGQGKAGRRNSGHRVFDDFHFLLPSLACRYKELVRSLQSPAES